jgi:hypothetical protein
MKSLSALIMLIIFSLSVFAQGMVVLHYYFNKTYIAQNLCENRDRPTLNCDGKCVLAKKLAAQEKEQQNSGIHFTEKFEVVYFDNNFIELPLPLCMVLQITAGDYHSKPLSKGFISIFQPPDCA